MTTLIAAYNSSGCIGRCDAKCYNAAHPDCDCICGGANHGAGLSQAFENTKSFAVATIKEIAGEDCDLVEMIEAIQPAMI